MNRPDRLNAPSASMVAAVIEAFTALADHRDTRVVVLAGAGKGFWSGSTGPSLRHAIEFENRTQVLGTFTGNMVAGMTAFLGKRAPNWEAM